VAYSVVSSDLIFSAGSSSLWGSGADWFSINDCSRGESFFCSWLRWRSKSSATFALMSPSSSSAFVSGPSSRTCPERCLSFKRNSRCRESRIFSRLFSRSNRAEQISFSFFCFVTRLSETLRTINSPLSAPHARREPLECAEMLRMAVLLTLTRREGLKCSESRSQTSTCPARSEV